MFNISSASDDLDEDDDNDGIVVGNTVFKFSLIDFVKLSSALWNC